MEVTKMFSRSSQNYIITSRIIQGQRDFRDANPEERADIVARWHGDELDMKGFQSMKRKERTAQKAPASPYQQHEGSNTALSTGSSSGWQSLLSSNDGLARLAARKEGWLRGIAGSASSSSLSVRPSTAEDAEYEQAIQASVRETSRGNPEEDAVVEAAIRQSVNAVRRQGSLPEPVRTDAGLDKKDPTIFEDKEYKITDEEYQALIEQAIQESLASQSHDISLPQESGFVELDGSETVNRAGSSGYHQPAPGGHNHDDDDDEDFRRAIEESKSLSARPSVSAAEDDEYERAIAASREETDREKSQRTEEDIVMEYVKKQSLAEAEYQRKRQEGQGRAPAANSGQLNDDDDEDLKRALEESLKMSRGDESGPSNAHGS